MVLTLYLLATSKHNKDLFLVYTILLRPYIGALLKYSGALRCMIFWCANNFVNRAGACKLFRFRSLIHDLDALEGFKSRRSGPFGTPFR